MKISKIIIIFLLVLYNLASFSGKIWAKYGIQIMTNPSLNTVFQIYKNMLDYPDLQIIKFDQYYALIVGSENDQDRLKQILYQIKANTVYRKAFIIKYDQDPIIYNRTILFKDMGLATDIMIKGVKPAFSFYLPVYSTLKNIRLKLPLKIEYIHPSTIFYF